MQGVARIELEIGIEGEVYGSEEIAVVGARQPATAPVFTVTVNV